MAQMTIAEISATKEVLTLSLKISPDQRTNESQRESMYLPKEGLSRKENLPGTTDQWETLFQMSDQLESVYLPKEGLSLKENLPETTGQWETLFHMIDQWESVCLPKEGLSLKENLPETTGQWETLFLSFIWLTNGKACAYLKKVWVSKKSPWNYGPMRDNLSYDWPMGKSVPT